MSATRNRGVDSSDSEYVALLDSDDVWHPEKLRLQVEALDAHPEYAFSYTAFDFGDGTPGSRFFTEPRSGRIDPEGSGWIYHQLILENWALPSSVVFRRSASTTLGPFLCDNQQTDDWEYLVRASRTFRFVRLAEPLVLYRQVPTSLSRRVPAQNWPELMRQSLLERFGMSSPDGQPVDAEALSNKRYLGWAHYADLHCARGDLKVGLSTFARLLRRGRGAARAGCAGQVVLPTRRAQALTPAACPHAHVLPEPHERRSVHSPQVPRHRRVRLHRLAILRASPA